ncbi:MULTISPECIES: hypothetical protein [Rheinheimera]|uniref:Uncharacterized protein n=1 Tax=Rheinheimera tilapiae TaxID=875043 RepID=A0ABV6B8L6_9GAMM
MILLDIAMLQRLNMHDFADYPCRFTSLLLWALASEFGTMAPL